MSNTISKGNANYPTEKIIEYRVDRHIKKSMGCNNKLYEY